MGWGGTIQRRGSFPVSLKKFKENNEAAAAEIAVKWIRKIRIHEHMSELICVKFNGEHDITELVREELNKPMEDILGF